jgi:hypothetical protein
MSDEVVDSNGVLMKLSLPYLPHLICRLEAVRVENRGGLKNIAQTLMARGKNLAILNS